MKRRKGVPHGAATRCNQAVVPFRLNGKRGGYWGLEMLEALLGLDWMSELEKEPFQRVSNTPGEKLMGN